MKQSLLANWTQEDINTVEEGVLVAEHRLAQTGLFTDDALAHILDTHPEQHVSISTMGGDPNVFDWREGERNGVSGRELLQLVRDGQLWINCRQMLQNNPDYARVFNQLYDEIEAERPGFKAQERTANLLISSPCAWVPYHVDMPVNMLWHIRGSKRVWVYPHFDKRFASTQVLEKVCSGEWSEDIPYNPSFDKYALVYDAQPGQLITWPQLAPHRVRNLEGLNVSLSTEHKNARARRRLNVHNANHLLRTQFGKACRSIEAEGITAHAKQVLARLYRFKGKFGKQSEQFVYPKTFVVDPDAPHGYRLKEGVQAAVIAPHQELEAMQV